MLEVLNGLIKEKFERQLLVGQQLDDEMSIAEFQGKLVKLIDNIKGIKSRSWLLYSENTEHFLLGLLALLLLDKKVIVASNNTPEFVRQISSEFDCLLTDKEAGLEGIRSLDLDVEASSAVETISNYYLSDYYLSGNEELVFFTSGSTGQPKSVNKTLSCLLNEVNTLELAFGKYVAGSLIASSVSHLHIYGLLFKVLWPLLTGRKILIRQIDYPEQLIDIGKEFNAIALISSPAFLSRLDANLHYTPVKVVFSSGGPLSYQDAKAAQTLLGELPLEIYGSTETGGIAFRKQQSETSWWTPFKEVLFESQAETLMLKSPHIPAGDKVVIDDLLEFNQSGGFILKGRKDRVVKVEEKRVSLSEIEQHLENFELIERCHCLLVGEERKVIGCAITLSEKGKERLLEKGKPYLIKSWKALLRERFEAITIPRKWRIISQLPINQQSKIDSQSLLRLFADTKERV